MDKEAYEIVNQLIAWHENKVAELQLILDEEDSTVKIGEHEIKPGTELHTGVQIGVKIALHTIGNLPIKITESK